MLAVSTSPFNIFLTRRLNTWYSVKDGNWSDPNTWMSNALDKKLTFFPQPGDNVCVNHSVVLDNAITTSTVNNLYVSGKLSFGSSAIVLSINGDLQVTGTVDQSGGANTIIVNGYNNFIVNYTAGSASTFIYGALYDQYVLNLSYNNLGWQGSGTKWQTSNLTITGNLNATGPTGLSCVYEVGTYNLTTQGTATDAIGANGIYARLSKSGAGSLVFGGNLLYGGNDPYVLNFSGNPSIEFQSGVRFLTNGSLNIGTGQLKFTTRNQTINSVSQITLSNSLLISGAITVTNNTGSGSNVQFNGVINGDNVASTFNNNNYLALGSATLPMATGVFNYKNAANSTLAFMFNGNYTIDSFYGGAFHNLFIGGTGTKTLSQNTILANNISSVAGSTLELSSYNLTTQGSSNDLLFGNISKSGSGAIVFGGFFLYASGITINFSGNPTIEFQNGFRLLNDSAFQNFGTGQISFTTRNQTFSDISGVAITLANNILVSGAITLTLNTSSFTTLTGVLNGNNASSIIDNRGTTNYQNATAPMTTGKLYCNQAANTFIYGLGGNQDITTPLDATPGYKNLTLNGSGAKRLLGNVSVKGTYTLTSPATLNSNGFALTNP